MHMQELVSQPYKDLKGFKEDHSFLCVAISAGMLSLIYPLSYIWGCRFSLSNFRKHNSGVTIFKPEILKKKKLFLYWRNLPPLPCIMIYNHFAEIIICWMRIQLYRFTFNVLNLYHHSGPSATIKKSFTFFCLKSSYFITVPSVNWHMLGLPVALGILKCSCVLNSFKSLGVKYVSSLFSIYKFRRRAWLFKGWIKWNEAGH